VKQSRRMSLVESLVNIVVGFGINMTAQIYVFALFGVHISLATSFYIGVFFTVISIARSYLLRRAFEAIRMRGIQ
jgi:hypothetical protein